MDKAEKNKISMIDNAAVALIGLLSLGYCVFSNRFAELCMNLPDLPFPIFIGEIVLFACLPLFISKWLITRQRINLWYGILAAYLIFVLTKAFYGYFKWGPLAFRHAALFYYPLFAVFGYFFYRRDFFTPKKTIALILVLLAIFLSNRFYPYDALPCLMLTVILINSFHRYRKMGYVVMALVLLIGCDKLFFQGGRAALISNIVSVVFIIAAFSFTLDIKRVHKVIMGAVLICALFIGVFKLGDSGALKAMVDLKQLALRYEAYNYILSREKSGFVMEKKDQIRIYNEEPAVVAKTKTSESHSILNAKTKEAKPLSLAEIKVLDVLEIEKEFTRSGARTQVSPDKSTVMDKSKDNHSAKTGIVYHPTEEVVRVGDELVEYEARATASSAGEDVTDEVKGRRNLRDFDSAKTTAIFRIFVWKDLLDDLNREKPLLGFDFGKPFRSKRIEMACLADGEWARDGWIAAHNSYLELIYRSGIVGIVFIIALFMALFAMIKQAIRSKTLNGILLCSLLISWLVSATFMLTLELPYNAIPFWSLSGMAFAYLFKNGPAVITKKKVNLKEI
ncbi:MAG: O-antigen ligase family protein [Candidatus Omnitrophota bacterium]|nr:O-antigen ligase family protein [Candidatus Omnitrophota bacterium]